MVRTIVDGSLLFASEAKALRAHESHVPAFDELALIARLAWEYPLDGTTLLKGVHHVRPGTVEVWELHNGNAKLVSRSDVERQVLSPELHWNSATQAEALLESFVDGVSQRLMGEVPMGIVLSGGLDSSLVAAVAHEAAERAGQPVPACWTVAESEDNPDWIAAETVASALDLEGRDMAFVGAERLCLTGKKKASIDDGSDHWFDAQRVSRENQLSKFSIPEAECVHAIKVRNPTGMVTCRHGSSGTVRLRLCVQSKNSFGIHIGCVGVGSVLRTQRYMVVDLSVCDEDLTLWPKQWLIATCSVDNG